MVEGEVQDHRDNPSYEELGISWKVVVKHMKDIHYSVLNENTDSIGFLNPSVTHSDTQVMICKAVEVGAGRTCKIVYCLRSESSSDIRSHD